MNHKHRMLAIGFLAAAALLIAPACSIFTVDIGSSPTRTPEATLPPLPENTPTLVPEVPATATPIPDPTAGCPTPSGDNSLYLNRDNGYCFLYPAGFSLQPDSQRPQEVINLVGPSESGGGMERLSVVLSVQANGPAQGLDSTAYAQRWYSIFNAGDPGGYAGLPGALGGYPAVILRNLPGFFLQRGLFAVVEGNKYQLTLIPQPEDSAELADAANRVWDLVTGTMVFFPPENTRTYIRAEDVCLAAGADTQTYRSDQYGYCFLYPVGFNADPTFEGRVEGGPVVLTDSSFGDVRTSLTVGTFGNFPGSTPRQVLESRLDLIDSLEDATVGGHPATFFRNPQGPWASKQAMILVDGAAYTIVAQPFEPAAYPDGMPYLNALWNTVTGSLRFYTPFR